MRPTRLGAKAIVFYALLVFSFFAAPYLNLFFLLLAFCTATGVLTVWWAWRNVTGLTGVLDDLRPMPAGASQVAHATMSGGQRPRFDLNIELILDDKPALIAEHLSLPPSGSNTIEVMLPPLPRGVHQVRRGRVSSIFPFGIVRARRALQTPDVVVVYPTPANLAQHRDRNGAAGMGGIGGGHTGEMGPSGLREFREGDELRHVHWKASARRQGLVIKELEGDSVRGVEVLLDLRAETEPLEEALSIATALAMECHDNKELLTLHTQDHTGTYGKGHQPLDALWTYLAGVCRLPGNGAAPPAVSPSVLRLPLAVPHATVSTEVES